MKFHSKVDPWLAATLLIPCVAAFFAASIVLSRASVVEMVGALFLVVVGTGLPLWILCATGYEVTDDQLLIRCGPLRWRIPIATISKVEQTRSPFSSPALSLDRILIVYGLGQSVMVSPHDKWAFLQAIHQSPD